MRNLTGVASIMVLLMVGCDRSSTAPSSPQPRETPAEDTQNQSPAEPATQAPVESESAPPKPQQTSAVAGNSGVMAPEEVDMDIENDENQLVKAEVLSRIDLMPDLSDEEKDKLYVQVERARGMGKMMTINFPTASMAVSDRDIEALNQVLALPHFRQFSDDPTVVFVILGFADKVGDPDRNLELSRARAESVVKALKERCGVMNVIHSVGMGSSEMFDAANLDKNRVVEIWAVLP